KDEVAQALQLIEKPYSDLFRSLPEDFTIQEKAIKEVRALLIKRDEEAIAPVSVVIAKFQEEQRMLRGRRKELSKSISKMNVGVERLDEKRSKRKDDGEDTADLDVEIDTLAALINEQRDESEALRRQIDGDTTFDFATTYERLEVIEDELTDADVADPAALKQEQAELKEKVEKASGLKHRIRTAKKEKYLIEAKNSHLFSKLNSLQTWPAKLHRIRETIIAGKQDERKHGNVEEIGNLEKRKTNKVKPFKIFPGMISEANEIAMGKQIADMILKSQGIKQHVDPVIAEYINRLGQNIVNNSDKWCPFTFHVLADPPQEREVNAFALPGGHVFVHDTLILTMKTEGELAAVLAHETAHVTARHAAKMISKMTITQYAAMAGVIFGGLGYLAYQGIGMLMNIEQLGISKNAESEADLLGAQYAWNAGYDPRLLIDSFDRLLKNSRLGGSSFWRTHPSLDDRMERVEEEARYLTPKANYVTDTSEFHDIQKLIKKGRLEINKTRKEEDKTRPTLKRKGECDNCEEETPDPPPVLKRKPKADPNDQNPDAEKLP
ncbi:MAG: M48 family metalloprotease, partial [bacterium]|nr:M48 family metalloprotease [bacterium]